MEVRNYPGLPHPLQQPVREASMCSGGTAPGTSSCAGWGLRPKPKSSWVLAASRRLTPDAQRLVC